MSILSPADIESLLTSSLASPVSKNNTRQIHKQRLNRSSDKENTYLPLSPLSETSSSLPKSAFSTIPENIISLITLKYLGYNDEMA